MSQEILVVDDEPDIRELLRFSLEQEGFAVRTAATGAEALEETAKRLPDLLVLDLMLPDQPGTEICRRLRANSETASIPIIMLTARSEEVDRVVGFELGADDYVTKPFSPRELVLRIRAVMRRGSSREDAKSAVAHKGLALDCERHRCSLDDREIRLTAKEFGLLEVLMRRPGRVLSRESLLETVWGSNISVTLRTVDTHVKRLREKLGAAGVFIETVRGVGYRFGE